MDALGLKKLQSLDDVRRQLEGQCRSETAI
jgi:hypothetical protein